MNLPYRLEIEEGVKQLNQSVFWVTAHDPDDGVSNMPQYFMTAKGQGADHVYNTTFAIKNPDFGNITLERELDYEQQTYYEYTVTSVDKGVPPCPGPGCKCNNFTEPNVVCEGIPAIFTVSVRDVQDTPPSFLKLPYYVSIYENVTNGTSIFGVNAIDGDRGVPNKISYTIFSEGAYHFTINEADGSIYVASALNADDPNGRNFNLQVMASELNTSVSSNWGT
ncbi:cadherin-related family member 1-like [Pomacea canaliculata]|uniref:cadherin-related family member 1-like n=1 Tax=Pomacea canaliculata TaxID=400727 RepID=UPI000D72B551|nr:cadherin-related family member 1-like [Pomacea canaliculata]XP_025085449.1 cadherin-related family member 1-like [Pomacea canaliculata]XP_025085456.1 cadherin-related family member 1-like [Pomacea canaliculata]